MATKTRTCGRGILRFTTLEPCRLPGQIVHSNVVKREEAVDESSVQNAAVEDVGETHVQNGSGRTAGKSRSNFSVQSLTSYFLLYISFNENLMVYRAYHNTPWLLAA